MPGENGKQQLTTKKPKKVPILPPQQLSKNYTVVKWELYSNLSEVEVKVEEKKTV
jgi:hypothetical protein